MKYFFFLSLLLYQFLIKTRVIHNMSYFFVDRENTYYNYKPNKYYYKTFVLNKFNAI